MKLCRGMEMGYPLLKGESGDFSSPAPTAIVTALHASGCQLRVVGGRIGIRGEVAPELRSLIKQHRQAVILALSPNHPEYWQTIVNAHGWDHAAIEWLNQNPIVAPAEFCTHCSGTMGFLVPFGVGESHAWLHLTCHTAWMAGRKATALSTLTALGVGQL